MKNQYVGDVNDYRKYGLINIIADVFRSKVLFVWMLTEDENTDGNKVDYLKNPQKYRDFNPQLFEELKKIVSKKQKKNDLKNILAITNNEIFSKYDFFNDFLYDKIELRESYFKEVYKLSKKYDLIFLDPDNGIEIKSCKYGAKKSSKFVYWNEIENIYNLNKDILIYQHYPRKERETYAKDLEKEICSKLTGAKVQMIKTPNTLFIFITKKSNELFKKLEKELSTWKGEIDFV